MYIALKSCARTDSNEIVEMATEAFEQPRHIIENGEKLTDILHHKQATNSLNIMPNLLLSMPEPIGREDFFCKYLSSELKKIVIDDLFDDVKMDILDVVRKKIKEQRKIIQEKRLFNPVVYYLDSMENSIEPLSSECSVLSTSQFMNYRARTTSSDSVSDNSSFISAPSPCPTSITNYTYSKDVDVIVIEGTNKENKPQNFPNILDEGMSNSYSSDSE